jgi:hypothetical protein
MQKFILLLLSVLFFCSFEHSSTIKSTLQIPAHEQFYLGGGQDFAFEASAKNSGLVPVTILLLLPDNSEKELIVLRPGEKTKAIAPKGSAMLFRNLTNVRAILKVVSEGSPQSLNMYYKKESEYQKGK